MYKMNFEYCIFYGIKKEYENYILENKEIYESTKKYFKYVNYKNEIKKKMEFINEELSKYIETENNYKNRLVTYNIRKTMFKMYEMHSDMKEELAYFENKINQTDFNIHIFKKCEYYEVEIHRLNKKLENMEKQFDSEYEII
jgi:hypothetical protein